MVRLTIIQQKIHLPPELVELFRSRLKDKPFQGCVKRRETIKRSLNLLAGSVGMFSICSYRLQALWILCCCFFFTMHFFDRCNLYYGATYSPNNTVFQHNKQTSEKRVNPPNSASSLIGLGPDLVTTFLHCKISDHLFWFYWLQCTSLPPQSSSVHLLSSITRPLIEQLPFLFPPSWVVNCGSDDCMFEAKHPQIAFQISNCDPKVT